MSVFYINAPPVVILLSILAIVLLVYASLLLRLVAFSIFIMLCIMTAKTDSVSSAFCLFHPERGAN